MTSHHQPSSPPSPAGALRAASARGEGGAVSTAHPAATAAGLMMLEQGGTAIDAAVAAHAVIAVVLPQSAGVGGDLLAIVGQSGEHPTSYSGVGRSSASPGFPSASVGDTVTVPGMLRAAETMHTEHGALPWETVLQPAIDLAREGFAIDSHLAVAVFQQRERLQSHAPGHPLLSATEGALHRQPELARLLEAVANHGSGYFYTEAAGAVVGAVQRAGGSLGIRQLAEHDTLVGAPIGVPFGLRTLWVQPPPSQGVLLAMTAQWAAARSDLDGAEDGRLDHLLIEVTESAFQHRDDVATGRALLTTPLSVDPHRAARRGGPRPYLHTAGVATADRNGLVVSSLSSVFDDFGSCIAVPEIGILLNNRASGFTDGRNSPAADSYPVHTLAPAAVQEPDGRVTALATPGADGQVQTLLAILVRHYVLGEGLAGSIARPRWRSQEGSVAIEQSSDARRGLRERGHIISERPDGDELFGAVVCAGIDASDTPFAIADWRRQTTAGALG